jgi:hypothetical protein
MELEAGSVNETPRLSHWQILYPNGRGDEAVVLLRGAVRSPQHSPRQFLRAELGATIVDIPLGEGEVRHLAQELAEAVGVLDAAQKDRAH